MNRYTALLSALVAVAACSSDSNKSADTTASVSVADTTVSTVAPASTTPTTATSSAAAIVPVNINTATDAEILRIPGVGSRMLREFKEYRPWTSKEQFRREIGKYVDQTELARLEQYVALP